MRKRARERQRNRKKKRLKDKENWNIIHRNSVKQKAMTER
jgi:hypothetical protein